MGLQVGKRGLDDSPTGLGGILGWKGEDGRIGRQGKWGRGGGETADS